MSIVEDTMQIYQLMWHLLGLCRLSTEPNHRWFTVYSAFVRFTVLIVFNMCFILAVAVANRIEDVIESMPIFASTLAAGLKAWSFLRTRQDVSQLIDLMKQLEAVTVIGASERSILLAAKRKSAVATAFFSFAAGIVYTLLTLNTFMQPERSLLTSALYPIDWQSNKVCYAVALIFQAVCLAYLAVYIVFLDMWRVAAFFLLDGFLDILSGRLQRIGWSTTDNELKNVQLVVSRGANQDLHHEHELINCVQLHLLCLKYARDWMLNEAKLFVSFFQIFQSARECL